jgi:predicted nucleic acid-binding protein
MILPDVNVLVHAHNADSPVHSRARRWWDECVSGPEGVGLAWAALLGFIRLTTNRKVVAEPPRSMTWRGESRAGSICLTSIWRNLWMSISRGFEPNSNGWGQRET